MNVCRTCLNYEGMRFYLDPRHVPARILTSLRVHDDGICDVCRAYQRERSELIHHALRNHLLAQLAQGEGALVLCSGGKDSVATVALTRGLSAGPVRALLFDNGFIPSSVVEKARGVTGQLGVPLVVAHPGVAQRREFHHLVMAPDPDAPPPCDACALGMMGQALALMDEEDISILVAGSNYWAVWEGQPLPAVSMTSPRGRPVTLTHLPYLLARTRQDTMDLLDELGFEPARLRGVSSNCRVPSLVQQQVSARVGHVPELEDLSLEVMVGHLPRAAAIAELYEKAPQHHALLDGVFSGAGG